MSVKRNVADFKFHDDKIFHLVILITDVLVIVLCNLNFIFKDIFAKCGENEQPTFILQFWFYIFLLFWIWTFIPFIT